MTNKRPRKQQHLVARRSVSLLHHPWFLLVVWLPVLSNRNVVLAAESSATTSSSPKEVCTIKSECQLCTAGDIETVPECKKTGKMATFTCVTMEDGDKVDSRHKVESCERTRADEEYLMIQLQVICLLVGSFTYMTVKRQRQLYASGFDQRKEFPGTGTSTVGGGATSHRSTLTNNSNLSSRTTTGGGLDRVSTAEERVPLANANDDEAGIEVV